MGTQADAEQSYLAGDFQRASEIYAALLADDPRNVVFLKGSASALSMGGQHDEAVAAAVQATGLQPANPEVRFTNGVVHQRAGLLDPAIRELEAALALKPNHVLAKSTLIEALDRRANQLDQVDPAAAANHRRRLTELNPQRNIPAPSPAPDPVPAPAPMPISMPPAGSMQRQQYGVSGSNVNPHAIPVPGMAAPQQVPDPNAGMIINQGASQMMACPNCRQMIMPQSKNCPYCRYQIAATQSNVNWQKDVKPEWQETAFNVVLVFLTLLTLLDIGLTLAGGLAGPETFSAGISAIRLVLFYGLFTRQDWAETWGRWFLILNIFLNSCAAAGFMMAGALVAMVVNVVTVALLGFTFYLLQYAYGETM